MFPSWSIPTNFKFRPIFPIEVQVHLESSASQLVKKPLSLSPIMKKKKQDHEGVWHFQDKWAMCFLWVEFVVDCKGNVH